MTVDSGYADIFGPQVPQTGDGGQTATFALASAAYRDNPVEDIKKADNEWHQSTVNTGRSWAKIFRPNLGEAFSQAVIDRMLGVGRKPLIQSFGTEPQVIVEHCLAANRIRRERDKKLTGVMVLCGLLFLPGLLVWLLVFQLRATMAKQADKRVSGLATGLFSPRIVAPSGGASTGAGTRPASPLRSAAPAHSSCKAAYGFARSRRVGGVTGKAPRAKLSR
ncbi:hypothetical protein SAURM35S_04637 [Streptomyces aurantiogriseus]